VSTMTSSPEVGRLAYKVDHLPPSGAEVKEKQHLYLDRPHMPSRIEPGQICHCVFSWSPRRYLYFDVVVGFVWSHDPKSYAGGSVCYW
jgi:hypothetical protein